MPKTTIGHLSLELSVETFSLRIRAKLRQIDYVLKTARCEDVMNGRGQVENTVACMRSLCERVNNDCVSLWLGDGVISVDTVAYISHSL